MVPDMHQRKQKMIDLSDANRPPKHKPDRWQPKWIREKSFGDGK